MMKLNEVELRKRFRNKTPFVVMVDSVISKKIQNIGKDYAIDVIAYSLPDVYKLYYNVNGDDSYTWSRPDYVSGYCYLNNVDYFIDTDL